MPGSMHRSTVQAELPAPYGALLEMEAKTSGRTVSEHLGHILSRRYMELIRICQCGFFIYDPNDDQFCTLCGLSICSRCAIQIGADNYCAECKPEGFDVRGGRWGVKKT